jgi:hypothetical protein
MFSACGTARIDACQKAGLPIMNGSGLFFEHHMDEIGGVPSASFFSKLALWKSTVRGLMPSVRPASLAGFLRA